MGRIKGIKRRRLRIRKKIVGTNDKPRLSVHRSHKNICAQLIDDIKGCTIISLGTNHPEIKKNLKYGGNVKAASFVGEALAKKALGKGIKKVVFDRSGYLYHGRVKALAEAARKGGLNF